MIQILDTIKRYLGIQSIPKEHLEYDLLLTEEERRQKHKREAANHNSVNLSDTLSSLLSNDQVKSVAIAVAVVVFLIIGFFVIRAISAYYNEKKPLEGALSELHYKRDKYILQYVVTQDGAWWDEIPSLGYDSHYDSRKVRSHRTESYLGTCSKQVLKTDSKGNSHYVTETSSCMKTKQVPVYSDWYAFSINKWERLQVITSEERQAKPETTLAAKWPIPVLVRELGTKACGASRVSDNPSLQKYDKAIGCQTVAGDSGEWYYASYNFTVNGKKQAIECPYDYNVWQNLRVSSPMYGEFYAHNEGVDCHDLHIGIRPTPTPAQKG